MAQSSKPPSATRFLLSPGDDAAPGGGRYRVYENGRRG